MLETRRPPHIPAGESATHLPPAPTAVHAAEAVEVAAMLGDSVIGVHYLTDLRQGKVTPPTLALLACGALMLLLSLFAFAAGVNNAAFNETARHEWIHRLDRPAHAFRPRRISPLYDWMAIGGALGGLVALSMGLARRRNERQPSCFRIGTAPDVELPLEGAPGPSFPLVAPSEGNFVFHFVPGMEGELRAGNEVVPLADLPARGHAHPSPTVPGAMQATIPAHGRIRIAMGKSTFLISSVPRPRRQAVPLFAAVERRPLTVLGGSAAVHLGVIALLLSLPPTPRALALDMRGGDERVMRMRSVAPETPREEDAPDNTGEATGGDTGTAMALEAGTMGTPESRRDSGRYALKRQDADPQLARAQATEHARNSGIVGAIRMAPGGAFASITASADFASGLDDANVYGGLHGSEAGAAQGNFGFARAGGGPGGGGPGWGTIGAGRYDTIGHGAGPTYGFGDDDGLGRGPGRRPIAPQVDIKDPITHGELDKSIIRRHIRQRLARFQHCYEKQLLATPNIAGTVETSFQISPQGTVLAATAHGVHDQVASCVADVIGNIQFPKPSGGGLVQVRYPFSFRTSGG